MVRKKLITIGIAACLALASALTAAPANAVTPTSAPSTASVEKANATTTVEPDSPAGFTAEVIANDNLQLGATAVHPNYPAGKYYYVCVSTDGSSYTLLYGVSTTTCHGAFLQQWLESGQFVQTIALTPSGNPATIVTIAPDCLVAIATGVVAVLTVENSWAWYTTAALSGYGLHACVSG